MGQKERSEKSNRGRREKRPRKRDDEDESVEAALIQSTLDDTEDDIQRYWRLMMLHAFLVECPLAILEGIVRCSILIAVLIWHLAVSCHKYLKARRRGDNKSDWSEPVSWAKELFFTVVATLALMKLVPVYFLYSKFRSEKAWKLSAMPTLIGWVDVRRFAVFTVLGQGGTAKNVSNFSRYSSSQDALYPCLSFLQPFVHVDYMRGLLHFDIALYLKKKWGLEDEAAGIDVSNI
jgi:hypothetical protein